MNLFKILPIALIIFISGCVAQVDTNTSSAPQEAPASTQEQPAQVQQPAGNILQGEVTAQEEQPPSLPTAHTIEITPTGFSPNTITIKAGSMVTFTNKDTAPHWPASAIHPTHCEYKGCGVFDAKKGLAQGESYSMVFDLAGNWRYHDHLNPSMTGTIVVQ